jgi:hypothetical protein
MASPPGADGSVGWGDGLRGAPTQADPIILNFDQLRSLPAVELPAFIECAGNARSFFASQQGTPASGTQWGLGAIGVASWRGARLGDVLERAWICPAPLTSCHRAWTPTM